ncbi:MAG: hypothetical protein J7576_02045 [Siphonobacter aquaeclarae]|nr:hypothetical protein [Siphonobacter aquaeclarae]
MWKSLVLFGGMAASCLSASAQDFFPETTLDNGQIKARFYLPDAEKGYYRAARFDWSGVIADLTYGGHTYFGKWFEKYDPHLHDAISGPVEEFTPIGYETAQPGETFLKIGVGMLRKKDQSAYRFFAPFENTNGGTWTTKVHRNRIVFVHELSDSQGYGYRYEKTVRLRKNKLILSHRLKNTGTKPLETTVYDHNFLVLDGQITGPDTRVTFPFRLEPEASTTPRGLGTLAQLDGNQWTYLRPLVKGESTHSYLSGFGKSAADYHIRAENRQIGVEIRGNKPLVRLVYWSIPTVFSPEPYIAVRANPGKTDTWTLEYTFFTR